MMDPIKNQEVTAKALTVTLLEGAGVVLKHKMLVIGMTFLAAVLSVVVTLFLPTYYMAVAKVLPPQNEGSGVSALLNQMGGLAGLASGGNGGSEADLYTAILKSRSLSDAVIDRLQLDKVYQIKSRELLRQKLHKIVGVQTGKDGIISVRAEDRDPKRAALLANTFVDELGRATVRLNLSKASSEKYFLEQRLEITRADLQRAEDDLKGFSERNKIIQPDNQAGVALGGIASLKANIVNSEVQLAVLRRTQTDESPEVKALVAGINQMKQDLDKMVTGRGNGDGLPSLAAVPDIGLIYARKLREVRIQEAVFEQLTKQYEIAKLKESRDSSSLQVLDQAVIPELKSRPKRGVIVILTTVAAFFASVLFAFGLEYHETMPAEQRRLLLELKEYALGGRQGSPQPDPSLERNIRA